MIARILRRVAVNIGNWTPSGVAERLTSGSTAARLLRPFVNSLIPDATTVVVVRSGEARGLRLPIRPREEKYYWTGDHECVVQRVLVRELRRGMIVWDIGAHIGFFSLIASRAVGPSGLVYAFEPEESNRRRLSESLRLNGVRNVIVQDVAVAGSEGHMHLYRHDSTTQWTLLRERGTGPSVEVPVTTLPLLADVLPRPHLIKIDAEGAELDILFTGAAFLEKAQSLLVVEFTSDDVVRSARGVLPGYGFEHLDGDHWLLRHSE